MQGNLESFPLVDVLGMLSSSQKSGRLVVNADRCGAALWLELGSIVGATTSAPGQSAQRSEPASVLFDLLRCREGAFYFEPDLRCPEPCAPTDTSTAISEAQAALEEWTMIVATVPSLTSTLTLQTSPPGTEVDFDERRWLALCAVVDVSIRDGFANVCAFVEHLGLGELDALRLAHELVGLGVFDVGPERSAAPAPAPAPAPSPAPTARSMVAPPELPGVGPAPAALEAAVADVPVLPGAPDFASMARSSDTGDVSDPRPALNVSNSPIPSRGIGTLRINDDSEAELARQLAMLSPRAAEAVAGAETVTSFDDARPSRVARFFDTP